MNVGIGALVGRLLKISPLMLVLLVTLTAAASSAQEDSAILGKTIGAGLAVGLTGVGAGIAVGVSGAAVVSALVERRELLGTLLIIVVLGEGIAIYGLLVALLLLLII